jgi:hypothetical protein
VLIDNLIDLRVISGLAELRTILDRLRSGDPAVLQLQRRGEFMYLAITIE